MSKERNDWPKQYMFSLESGSLQILFHMTAPFEKLYCYDKISLTLITPDYTYQIANTLQKDCATIAQELLPLGLIKEKIDYRKYPQQPSFMICSKTYWLGKKYALWNDIQDESNYYTWLYPNKAGLVPEVTHQYEPDDILSATKSFNTFAKEYTPFSYHVIPYKIAQEWYKKLKIFEIIVAQHHKSICLKIN